MPKSQEKKATKVAFLEEWCAEKRLFSKADLHKYGYDNHYIRAWRTVCDFVTEGKAHKLSDAECEGRGLTTSMAWYEWIGEAPDTDTEAALRRSNELQEEKINRQAYEKNGQLQFIP